MTGLVAGSIVPDFEMFLKMKAETSFSHTLSGVFYINLPLALLLSFLFHLLIRDVLIAHLPSFLRVRFNSFRRFDWVTCFKKNAVVVILSIVAGICLHILWDGFTHKNGFFVKQLPYLETRLPIGSWDLPLYYLLQLGFSLVGGLIVFFSIFLLPLQEDPHQVKGTIAYWVVLFLLALPVFAAGMQQEFKSHYLSNVIVQAISALLVSLLLTSSYLRFFAKA